MQTPAHERRQSAGTLSLTKLCRKACHPFGPSEAGTVAHQAAVYDSSRPEPLGSNIIAAHWKTTSKIIARFRSSSVKVPKTSVEVRAEPHHRTARVPPSALATFTFPKNRLTNPRHSSIDGESRRHSCPPPGRRVSVRFLSPERLATQVDGPAVDTLNTTAAPSNLDEARSDTQINRLARQLSALGTKLTSSNHSETVIRRKQSSARPKLPFIDTNPERILSKDAPDGRVSQSTISSLPSKTRASNFVWSPRSAASTAGTSLTSPDYASSGVGKLLNTGQQTSIEACIQAGEESVLPVIDEDRRRVLRIPILDAPIINSPTIATVEKTAAAKCALEIHFQELLFEPHTPRSLRRERFEKRIFELGLPHEQRQSARRHWIRAESDHLRQMRILKSSSLARQSSKGISIAGFDVIRVLGKGSFGIVRLVTERIRSSIRVVSADMYKSDERRAGDFDPNGSINNIANMDGTAKRAVPTGQPLTDVFAMKVIRKSDMLRARQEGHLRAERDFLVGAEGSRWIVPLIASFQDSTNLYLVMEYMIGGDFLGLLLREDVLEEAVAQWYCAEMILCIEEAHRMKWIHRDIKPDNFLISASGHLKISDFGLSFSGHWAHSQSYYNIQRENLLESLELTIDGDEQDLAEQQMFDEEDDFRTGHLHRRSPGSSGSKRPTLAAYREGLLPYRNRTERRRLARSMVGTTQYMAPEILLGHAYDGRCDWWSVAIILYECLYGHTPFYCAEDRHRTKVNIISHRRTLHFPTRPPRISRPTATNPLARRCLPPPSDDAVDLLRSILTDKEMRLSSRQYRHTEARLAQRLSATASTSANLSRALCNHPSVCHVYANDAAEIKAHPFFDGIDWEQLHLQTPPFVPRVREHQSITKYFENEQDILRDANDSCSIADDAAGSDSDLDDDECASTGHNDGRDQERNLALADQSPNKKDEIRCDAQQRSNATPPKITFQPTRQGPVDKDETRPRARGQPNKPASPPLDRYRPKRLLKRARDKVLRDPNTAHIVLDVRKKNAFFGYTYRRPKPLPLLEYEGRWGLASVFRQPANYTSTSLTQA